MQVSIQRQQLRRKAVENSPQLGLDSYSFLSSTTRFLFAERATKTLAAALVLGCLASAFFVFTSRTCQAQAQPLPNQDYYLSFNRFYLADYRDAQRDFRRAETGAIKFGNVRFLDSVCYWTMLGETYYHMGNYAEAISLYEQALGLYAQYQDDNWQTRIQNAAINIQPDTAALAQARINWGTPRVRGVANVPNSFQVMFGQFGGVQQALQQGGVAQAPKIRQVNVTEIMRCVALCMHRRRVIKGPTAKYDPLSSRLVRAFNKGARGDGSIIGSYNGVCLAIAYATMEDWAKASAMLKRSLVMAGGLEHPLTPVGQLQAAYIGLAIDNNAVASQLALEASYSAAIFNQFDLIAEALAVGATVHLKTNRSAYPPLRNAIQWANRTNARLMHATAIVRLAECLSEAGNVTLSQQILRDSSRVINRRNTLQNSVIGARLKYVSALNQFLAADFANGQTSLANAIEHFRTGSLWLYRLKLANVLAANSAVSQRQIDQLYSVLLRDPGEMDWRQDPFEAIAFLSTPHVASMELWFEVAIARRDYKKAFAIAEQVRRHRFFASLPMGGRLMAFRWIMHAPPSALNSRALEQRTKFLNRNTGYKQTLDRVAQIKVQLKEIPLASESGSDDETLRQQLLTELATISAAQESTLASNALRREPSEMAFPPKFTEKQIRSVIRPDQLALVTLATGNGYHFFIVDQSSIQYTGFYKTRNIHRAVAAILKGIGASDVAVDTKKINNNDWQKDAKEFADSIFSRIIPDQWDATKELVVVPDGALWYLPFEILMLGEEEDPTMIADRINVRYSPTASLAFGGQRPIVKPANLVVATDKLSPKTELELSNDQYLQILDPLPESVQVSRLSQSSNLIGDQIDRLLAWSYIKSIKNVPQSTKLLSIENQNLDNGSINAWMSLPWGAPQHVILPGYQSPGITLKGRSAGSDMFLITTGLMASGTRTALISRWNSAGKTALQLSGHYAANLQENDLHKALAEGRKIVKSEDIDYANEPRLRSKPTDATIQGEHPYFWASHMLLGIPDDSEPKITSGKSNRPSDLTGLQPPNLPVEKKDDDKAANDANGLMQPKDDDKKDDEDDENGDDADKKNENDQNNDPQPAGLPGIGG
jgi:tetratricopeptide (TPR) repeat protein